MIQPVVDVRAHEQAEALDRLAECSDRLEQAKLEYERALLRAKDLGIPNTVIARRVGRTEAAIRMFVQRKKLAS